MHPGVQFSLTDESLSPNGIVACGDGTHDYIVAFRRSNRVCRISGLEGREKWTIASVTVGSLGRGDSNFSYPWHVAVLPGGHAVVADSENNRLQVLDIATGAVVKQLG